MVERTTGRLEEFHKHARLGTTDKALHWAPATDLACSTLRYACLLERRHWGCAMQLIVYKIRHTLAANHFGSAAIYKLMCEAVSKPERW